MLQTLLLAAALFFFTRNVFRFEKISRFELLVIPVYSFVIGGSIILENPPTMLALFLTILLGGIVGWFQTTGLTIHLTAEKDKRDRPIIEVRRGWQYLVGWLVIFAYGLGFAFVAGHQVDILTELSNELMKDLFSWENFTPGTWNIMIQSAVASLVYTRYLVRQEPRVKAAIARKKRAKN